MSTDLPRMLEEAILERAEAVMELRRQAARRIQQLEGELSRAEEGLANAAQELEEYKIVATSTRLALINQITAANQEIEQLRALLWLVPSDYIKEIDDWQTAQSEVHPRAPQTEQE